MSHRLHSLLKPQQWRLQTLNTTKCIRNIPISISKRKLLFGSTILFGAAVPALLSDEFREFGLEPHSGIKDPERAFEERFGHILKWHRHSEVIIGGMIALNVMVYGGWKVNPSFMRRHFLCNLENVRSKRSVFVVTLKFLMFSHFAPFDSDRVCDFVDFGFFGMVQIPQSVAGELESYGPLAFGSEPIRFMELRVDDVENARNPVFRCNLRRSGSRGLCRFFVLALCLENDSFFVFGRIGEFAGHYRSVCSL